MQRLAINYSQGCNRLEPWVQCRGGITEGKMAEGTPSSSPTVAGQTSHSQVSVGPCLPSISNKLLEKVRCGEYVDFSELLPDKGNDHHIHQAGEGQIFLIQAADLSLARKAIPDLATWLQCFGLYVAALAPSQPHWIPELMAYQASIVKAS